jgi:hypothetical protein
MSNENEFSSVPYALATAQREREGLRAIFNP